MQPPSFYLLATLDCSGAAEKLRAHYTSITQLSIDFGMLFSKDVITLFEKKTIDNIEMKNKKIEFLLDEILIPSLSVGMIDKYTRFIKVLKESKDSLLNQTANIIGKLHGILL